MEYLKELAIRAQIPPSKADEVIRILASDDGHKPNFGRSDEENEAVRQFRNQLVDANVLDTPI